MKLSEILKIGLRTYDPLTANNAYMCNEISNADIDEDYKIFAIDAINKRLKGAFTLGGHLLDVGLLKKMREPGHQSVKWKFYLDWIAELEAKGE